MSSPKMTRHWWRDQFARLIITVIGGVVAALILLVLIPAIQDSGSGAGDDPTQQETDATQDAPAEEPPAEEAPAEDG